MNSFGGHDDLPAGTPDTAPIILLAVTAVVLMARQGPRSGPERGRA